MCTLCPHIWAYSTLDVTGKACFSFRVKITSISPKNTQQGSYNAILNFLCSAFWHFQCFQAIISRCYTGPSPKQGLCSFHHLSVKHTTGRFLSVDAYAFAPFINALYVICNARDYCWAKTDGHAINALGMMLSISNTTLHWKFEDGELHGVIEVIWCFPPVDGQFEGPIYHDSQSFEYKPQVFHPFGFFCCSTKVFEPWGLLHQESVLPIKHILFQYCAFFKDFRWHHTISLRLTGPWSDFA